MVPGAMAERENTKRLITVPTSLFARLGLGSSWLFFDRDKAVLNDSGREVLGLDETKAKAVSTALHNSAERFVEIQKRFANVKANGPHSWIVEIALEANAAKAASVSLLSSDLQNILPAAKAEFLTQEATNCLMLGGLERTTQTFLVKMDGDYTHVASRTPPYGFNATMSDSAFRSSIWLSWIDEVIKKQAP